MKNTFKKIAKIITYICIVEIALMIIFLIAFGSNDNVTIPNWIGVIFLGTLYITLLILMVAFILCIIDAIKKRDKRYFLKFIATVVILEAIYIIGNLITKDEKMISAILSAFAISIVVTAGEYIFGK